MAAMNHIVCLLFWLLKDAAANCNGEWHEFRERCYYASPVDDFQDYANATKKCVIMEAYLASVTSQKLTDFFKNDMKLYKEGGCGVGMDCDQNYEFWIGLTTNLSGVNMWANMAELRTGWTWQEDHRYEWQNWRDKEPAFEERYARMRGDGSWGGSYRSDKYRYICEQEEHDSEEIPISTTTTLNSRKPEGESTQSPPKPTDAGPSIFLYVGPVIGVVVAIVIVVVVIVLCRKRRAAKDSLQNEMYYNTRGDLNNSPNKIVNIQADSRNQYAHDSQLPPGHNYPPLGGGPMYAEIDKGGQRNSMQGPPTAAKPVDNGRISAMYAQPDLTAKKNRRNVNTAPDEDVTLVENSTYATTLPK